MRGARSVSPCPLHVTLLGPLFPLLFSSVLVASDWPTWRGPGANGITTDTNLPIHWSTTEQVLWRVGLPEPGNGTPVVAGDRVFVSQAVSESKRRWLICLDRHKGRELWRAGIVSDRPERTHRENPPCTPSPTTDGRRVVVWWGGAGLYCYDTEGRELWHRDLGPVSHAWGYASSPILYRDLCLLNFGPAPRNVFIALDVKTGRTVWQAGAPPLPPSALEGRPEEESASTGPVDASPIDEWAGSWATPVVAETTGGVELVIAFPGQLAAYDPADGRKLWTCRGTSIGAYSSPFFNAGLIGLTGSGYRNAILAVRTGGRGDVTETHRLWKVDPGNSRATVGSGVIHQGHMYLAHRMGLAHCIDVETGATIWEERLTGTGARNAISSSLLLAGGLLYVANENADVFVLKASPKFQCLATNSLGGELMRASLAVSDGDLFIRTYENLWCIRSQDRRENHPTHP